MAFGNVVRDMVIQLRFAVDSTAVAQVNDTIGNLQGRLARMGSMSNVRQSMAGVASTARKIALGLGAATGGLAFFLNEAGQFNKTEIAFKTMADTAENGKKLLQDLHEFALKTPFSLKDVELNASMLLGMGIATEKVLPTMELLGNVAAGINRPLGMIALNFGQIKTAGFLAGTELRDFRRQGVPIMEQLQKNLGKTGQAIREMVSKKEISFEQVQKAFEDMSAEGGRFANLMFKQAKTWPVMINNFLIHMRILSREIGQALLPEAKKFLLILINWIKANKKIVTERMIRFFKTFLKILVRIGRFFRDITPRIKGVVKVLGGMVNVMKILAIAMGVLFGLQIVNLIGSMAFAIGTVIAAMFGMLSATAALNVFMGFLPLLIGLVIVVLALLAQDIFGFFNGQDSLLGRLIDRWKDWKNVVQDLIDVFGLLPTLITKLITGKSIGEWLIEGFEALMNSPFVSKTMKFLELINNTFFGKKREFVSSVSGGKAGAAETHKILRDIKRTESKEGFIGPRQEFKQTVKSISEAFKIASRISTADTSDTSQAALIFRTAGAAGGGQSGHTPLAQQGSNFNQSSNKVIQNNKFTINESDNPARTQQQIDDAVDRSADRINDGLGKEIQNNSPNSMAVQVGGN